MFSVWRVHDDLGCVNRPRDAKISIIAGYRRASHQHLRGVRPLRTSLRQAKLRSWPGSLRYHAFATPPLRQCGGATVLVRDAV